MSWNLGAPCARARRAGWATRQGPSHDTREIAKPQKTSQIGPWIPAGLCRTWRLRHTEPPYRVNNAATRYAGASRSNWGYAICCFVPDVTRPSRIPAVDTLKRVSMRNDGLSLCVDPGRTPLVPVIKYQKEQIPGLRLRCCSQLMLYYSVPCFFLPWQSRGRNRVEYQMSIVQHSL